MKRKQFPQFAGGTNIHTQEAWGSHVCMENHDTWSFEDIQKAPETQGHLVREAETTAALVSDNFSVFTETPSWYG